MFLTVLFIIAKNLKQPTCPSMDEWINCGIFLQWNATLQEKGANY